MKKIKIVLLGGGSLYFESVMAEIACTPELSGAEIMLYDINAKRMDLMRRVGLRIAEKTKSGLDVRATTDLAKALDGSDFAIASIGVHGHLYEGAVKCCEISAKFGIMDTTGDTTGPGGLSQGLQIIPIFLNIAKKMEQHCPRAILLNHSNPMSPVCRAVKKYTSIEIIGYCHNVSGDIDYFGKVLGVPPKELEVIAAGPNHCLWLLGISHQGRDMYPELKKRLAAREAPDRHKFAQEVFEMFDLFPIGADRHLIEFFPHCRRATTPKNIEYNMVWAPELAISGMKLRELNKEPEAIELKAAGKKEVWLPGPDELSPEAMGHQIKAIMFGPAKIHYVNTTNRNAVTNLPPWAVLELRAAVGHGGAKPVYIGEMPAQAARWSAAQLFAHELMVDAAAETSRKKAIMALACDPRIRDFKEAKEIFDAMVKGLGERLKKFRKS